MDNLTHSLVGLALGEIVDRALPPAADPQRARTRHRLLLTTGALASDVPALERFATGLGFVFQKVPGKDFAQNPEDYSVEHSANLAVLDPQGRLAGVIRPPFNAQAIARDLQMLTEKSAP